MTLMSRPHGGRLVSRTLTPAEEPRAREDWRTLPTLRLSAEETATVVSIAEGAYSPLTGFLSRADYESVLARERLADGTPWTLPVVLHVDADRMSEGEEVGLAASDGAPLAIVKVRDVFPFPREAHAKAVYGTTDPSHPGVRRALSAKSHLAGGEITLVTAAPPKPFPGICLSPAETRARFEANGWRTVAGYQTRNAPHRAHEFLHKLVLGLTDGLLIHPVIGRKKPGDFRDEVILDAYEAALANYYPRDRVLLAALPYEMQYAGPKEAIHHAIVRKNFGCSHFIVGRDHAGVGSFYGAEDAIRKFDDFPDLGIAPIAIKGDHFWCHLCGQLESERTCPHGKASHVPFSGTLIRNTLLSGAEPPREVLRAEVFAAIRKHPKPFHE